MQQKPKKQPVRHCLGCGQGKTKKELVRVVRSKEGKISLDTTGKAPGRGAYLCNEEACLAKAQKKRSLERALSVEIPKEIYEQLQKGLCDEHK